jgi:membrane fusion protein, multidrug efflux system
MFDERDDRETRGQTLLEAERSDSRLAGGASARESIRMKADVPAGLLAPPQRGERPGAEPKERPTTEPKERPAVEPKSPPGEPSQAGEQVRKGWLRRHPVAAAFGLLFLLVAGAAGYLYWDYSTHFESTDDAFIAARQFAIAPKVPGYVTAVQVTDNEHVNKGGVIARIDQRDYRVALAQAEAQVAGAEAGIHNIDAQIDTQNAQIAANQAQVAQAQANLDSCGSPGDATSRSSIRGGRRLSRARSTSRILRHSRPLSRARKRRSKWRSGKSTR